MSSSRDDPLYHLTYVSINTAIVAGVIAVLSNSIIMYSMAFTSVIVGFVAVTAHLVIKKK